MEQKQESDESTSSTKQKTGQSGSDGHAYRRTKRIEMRVSPIEHAQLSAMALGAGYKSLAQYLRENGLNVGRGLPPTADYHHQLLWLQVLNRIGNHLDQVALQLTHGKEPDEEMLMYVMQIQELAEQTWQEAKKEKGQPSELK
jgi:hypothetical protein